MLDIGVFFLAAERCQADQERHSHGNEADGGQGVVGHDARSDEEGESWYHTHDGDDSKRAVLLPPTIASLHVW